MVQGCCLVVLLLRHPIPCEAFRCRLAVQLVPWEVRGEQPNTRIFLKGERGKKRLSTARLGNGFIFLNTYVFSEVIVTWNSVKMCKCFECSLYKIIKFSASGHS